jgi:lysophospholipase L1-like esterase
MFIPASKKNRRPTSGCTRTPRFVVVASVVVVGFASGLMPSASADPLPPQNVALTVDIIGDSYAAGDGLSGAYLDPADQRNRSRLAPALQALSRVAQEQPGLVVDANLAASAGAVTADFFDAQKTTDGSAVVNTAQRDQIRPSAQVVIVGFGGNDAELARVLGVAIPSNSTKPGDLDAEIRSVGDLLDLSESDQAYLDQASSSAPGQAPTLVSRMLQVLAGIAQRAPGARIVVTNYPLAIDAQDPNTAALINSRDLATVQKFIYDLNESIARAVRICECAGLIDMSAALAGHEAYTSDSAFTEQNPDRSQRDQVQPSDEGAALMANPIATDLAELLGIRSPEDSDGTVTEPWNIQTRTGVSDRDGDLVPDLQDTAPDDRTHGQDKRGSAGDTPRSDRDGSDHRGPRRSGIPSINIHLGLPSPDPDRTPALPIPLLQGLPPNNKPAIARDDAETGPDVDDPDAAVEDQTTFADIGRAQEARTPPGVASPLSQEQATAMADVIYKAQPAGYVSAYSTLALRVSTLPADERISADMTSLDGQMSQSFLSDEADKDVRDGFRAQFGENINAIHNATTVAEQDAAIAQFDQTAMAYNAAELAERDAYGAHPVDERGETVRITPTALGDLAAETTTDSPVDAPRTLPAFDVQAPAVSEQVTTDAVAFGPLDVSDQPADSDQTTVSEQVTTVAFGPADVSGPQADGDDAPAQTVAMADVATDTTSYSQADATTLAAAGKPAPAQSKPAKSGPSVNVDSQVPGLADPTTYGPVATGEVAGSSKADGTTISGKAEGSLLGGETSLSGAAGPGGVNGKIGAKGYVAEGSFTGEADYGNGAKVGYDGKGSLGGEIGAHGKYATKDKGFDVGVNGSVHGEVSVGDSGQIGVAEASRKATASVGAEAEAHAKVADGNVDIGSKAHAGAKAGIDVKGGFPGFEAGFRAEGWAGPGYEGRLKAGKDDKGSYTFGLDGGFSPMFGGKAGFSISVNPDKLRQSVEDAVNSLNPFGPAAQMDSPRSLAQNDPNYDGPVDAPADTPADAPADAPADTPADALADSPDAPAESPDVSELGESQMNSPRSQAQHDPNYDGPVDTPTDAPADSLDAVSDPDAAISSNTVDSEITTASLGEDGLGTDSIGSDTVTGAEGTDTLGGDIGTDTLGTSPGDTGFGDTGMADTGMADTGMGDLGLGDSGMGDSSVGDSGGGDSGVGGDSSGMGDSSGGTGGDSSGGMGGDGGSSGGDGGSSSAGMGSGGMSGGPGGGDGGGF